MLSRGRSCSNALECDSKFVRCLILLSWMTSCTGGIPRSLWIISLFTHHEASTMALNIFDWHLRMTAILDLQAQPHNSMPYAHIGVIMDLYSRRFLSTARWDFQVTNRVLYIVGTFIFVSWWCDPSSSAYCLSATLDIWLLQMEVFLHYFNRLLCLDRFVM